MLLLGRHRGVGRVWSQTAVSPPALSGQATDVSCASVSLLIKSDGGGGGDTLLRISGGTEQATLLQASPAVCST